MLSLHHNDQSYHQSNRHQEIYAVFMCVALPFDCFHGSCRDLDVYNKIDAISLEQTDKLARQPNTVVISCEMDLKSAKGYVLFLT